MAVAIILIILFALLLLLIYAFLIMPRVVDAADMELQSSDYAHRGLWNKAVPENSLEAFALAVKHGYGIELDIRLSHDGHVMVFHDDNLLRMCGIQKTVSELTCDELKALSLNGTESHIPELSEVFDLVRGRVPLLIEIKSSTLDEKLCRAAAELLDCYGGAFAIQSFNPQVLSWFKQYRPRFARGQLVTKTKNYREGFSGPGGRVLAFALAHMLTNVISRPDFISVEGTHINTPEVFFINKICRARCFVWTARNPRAYNMIKSKKMFAIFEVIRP